MSRPPDALLDALRQLASRLDRPNGDLVASEIGERFLGGGGRAWLIVEIPTEETTPAVKATTPTHRAVDDTFAFELPSVPIPTYTDLPNSIDDDDAIVEGAEVVDDDDEVPLAAPNGPTKLAAAVPPSTRAAATSPKTQDAVVMPSAGSTTPPPRIDKPKPAASPALPQRTPPVALEKGSDCPLCKRSIATAESLPGGRLRCGRCGAIFFPGAPAPRSWESVSSPASRSSRTKSRPKPAVSGQPPFELSVLIEHGKRPLPIAIVVFLLLTLGYLYFPTNLFGSNGRLTVHPATGEISYESRPIPNASIVLHPVDSSNEDAPRPKATVGADGRFVLNTYAASDGAPAGEYRVTVQWFPPPTANEVRDDTYIPRNQLPARYARPETSGLTVTIEPGENQLPPIRLRR